MNFRILFLEWVFLTNADLISWNRGWNGLYRFSKGKQFMKRPVNSIDIPEYTCQLNNFLRKSFQSEIENSKVMAEFLKKLRENDDFEKVEANDSDLTSRREMKKNRKFGKNRYDRFENFKDHYLRFQLA